MGAGGASRHVGTGVVGEMGGGLVPARFVASARVSVNSMTDFIKVAELDDLEDGELMGVEVDGEPICLAKVEGTVYAFTDDCTHIGGPLNEGELDGEVLTCPWHGAQFNVCTGKVLRGPARQDISTYPVRIDGASILISLPDA